MRASTLISDFISLFYPRYCYGCRHALVAGEDILCTHCIFDLPKADYHLHPDNPIARRLANRLPVQMAGALLKFRKGGQVQHLLHELKYNNRPEVGEKLGRIYGHDLKGKADFEVIVPVPLHPARLRQRGYNQSARFATGIAEVLSITTLERAVIRTKKTTTQTRKSRVERWENVKDSFEVLQPSDISGKSVLLVDDVFTTGATIEACGQPLVELGCKVSVVCIAHAQ